MLAQYQVLASSFGWEDPPEPELEGLHLGLLIPPDRAQDHQRVVELMSRDCADWWQRHSSRTAVGILHAWLGGATQPAPLASAPTLTAGLAFNPPRASAVAAIAKALVRGPASVAQASIVLAGLPGPGILQVMDKNVAEQLTARFRAEFEATPGEATDLTKLLLLLAVVHWLYTAPARTSLLLLELFPTVSCQRPMRWAGADEFEWDGALIYRGWRSWVWWREEVERLERTMQERQSSAWLAWSDARDASLAVARQDLQCAGQGAPQHRGRRIAAAWKTLTFRMEEAWRKLSATTWNTDLSSHDTVAASARRWVMVAADEASDPVQKAWADRVRSWRQVIQGRVRGARPRLAAALLDDPYLWDLLRFMTWKDGSAVCRGSRLNETHRRIYGPRDAGRWSSG